MSGLVGYGSSDEDDDIQNERPAKIPKLDPTATDSENNDSKAIDRAVNENHTNGPEDTRHSTQTRAAANTTIIPPTALPAVSTGASLPLVGAELPTVESLNPGDPPLSPYTFERQRLRELTMPSIPNFDIPDSPPPPPSNSEEAASLAARTKKFERFLEMKKQDVHFNERLHNSSSLRNPSLLPKLMDFAGISTEASYASTLPDELGVPVRWPEDVYVEGLLKASERREKKRKAERDKVEFVPAAISKSTASSTRGTPAARGGEHRKQRYDRK